MSTCVIPKWIQADLQSALIMWCISIITAEEVFLRGDGECEL